MIYIRVKNMPIAITGDGVYNNNMASRLLCTCYSLNSPNCHFADLVMKRMATSKTMSVPEVVTCYDFLRPIIKYFEKSTKSKDKLDEAIAILDLKQINLISWIGTRMAHFVYECHQFTKLLMCL